MFTLTNITIIGLWIASGINDFADFLYWWQLKEYRLDKFRDFLSTKRGKRFWFRYSFLLQMGAGLVALFWPFNNVITLKFFLVAVLVTNVTYGLYLIAKRGFRRPQITLKALLLLSLALIFELVVLYITRDWFVAFFLLLMRIFTISFLVILMKGPTSLVKKLVITLATNKLKKYKNVSVIGITGSYGKTTVKEFLAHILKVKHSVICTPKNINTEIGVALFILKNDFSKKDIFIVEMGAYKIGDIKILCDMTKPTYGILTAINEQHLSLFGSIKNTQKAKYELLRALPANGVAITNSDNMYCREFLDQIDAKVETFGLHEEYSPLLLISDIKEDRKNKTLSCSNTINGKTFEYTTNIPGRHNTKNIAACMLLAHHFDLTHQEVQQQVETLCLPAKTLQIFEYGDCVVIDDSRNSNPDGFKGALDLLSSYSSSRKRIVITRGMHELGPRSAALHEEVGGEIDFVADVLVITNNNFAEDLQRGMVGKYKTDILLRYDQDELLEYVKSLKHTSSVILLENKLRALVYDEIKGNTK